jgi:phenylpropionate dioxygenase-like ring-hydroxylating dioxygenase large terminal subunit
MTGVSDGGFRSMVNLAKGTVERKIFSDPDIYQMELERIFARAWNFMCHESQIPNPGDFFLSFIGEESVIATRDRTGKLQVFLNSCRHRGNAVCRADSGNTRSFLCTYHGWTYGLDGKLIGVPGYKELYHEKLDRSQWGLISAAKVESYKGFVFATMDPDAPSLYDYLGEVGRLGLDLTAERGDLVAVEGVQKNVIGCNWKLAVDNVFDFYHAIAHTSAVMTGYTRRSVEIVNGPVRVVLGEYGHAIGGPPITPDARKRAEALGDNVEPYRDERWRDVERARVALGAAGRDTRGNPNIFPNLWVASGHNGTQLSLRLPKGPNKTEIWWFTLVDKNLSPQRRAAMIDRANHTFGPAGMLEQDDGENWDQSTRQTRGVIARRYPLNYSLGLGRGEPKRFENGPAVIDTRVNEHAQLWTYRNWAEWMDADSWAALQCNHSQAPTESRPVSLAANHLNSNTDR